MKTTKSVTLQPFPTTSVYGFKKMRRHRMRLNLTAGLIAHSQLSSSNQCTPTYCNQESSSSRITVGFRNVSAKKITIPAKAVIFQMQLANRVPKLYAEVEQMSTEAKQEEDKSWILEQLDLVDYRNGQKNSYKLLMIFYGNQLIHSLKMLWISENAIY